LHKIAEFRESLPNQCTLLADLTLRKK